MWYQKMKMKLIVLGIIIALILIIILSIFQGICGKWFRLLEMAGNSSESDYVLYQHLAWFVYKKKYLSRFEQGSRECWRFPHDHGQEAPQWSPGNFPPFVCVRYIFESRILLLLAYDACLIWSEGGDSGEGGDDGREATDLEFVRQAAAQVLVLADAPYAYAK